MWLPNLDGGIHTAKLRGKEVIRMEIKIVDDKLTIIATLGSGVPSRTGKTLVVATTNGFQVVAGTKYRVSLNVIKERAR